MAEPNYNEQNTSSSP